MIVCQNQLICCSHILPIDDRFIVIESKLTSITHNDLLSVCEVHDLVAQHQSTLDGLHHIETHETSAQLQSMHVIVTRQVHVEMHLCVLWVGVQVKCRPPQTNKIIDLLYDGCLQFPCRIHAPRHDEGGLIEWRANATTQVLRTERVVGQHGWLHHTHRVLGLLLLSGRAMWNDPAVGEMEIIRECAT
jgi:hypothetical protein